MDPPQFFPAIGRIKNVDFPWNFGFRAITGYNFSHDGWDLCAEYTMFNNRTSKSCSAKLQNIIIPLKGSASIASTEGGVFVYGLQAKSHYEVDFRSLDVKLGRHFFVSKRLSLHPKMGLMSIWLDLQQGEKYRGGDLVLDVANNDIFFGTILNSDFFTVQDINHYKGFGPKTEVGINYYLGSGFSCIGEAAIGMIFGLFRVQHKEKFTGRHTPRVRLREKHHNFSPVLHLDLGLAYQTYFNDRRNCLSFRLGCEYNYFWRVNQMKRVTSIIEFFNPGVRYASLSEDISIVGVTFNTRVDF